MKVRELFPTPEKPKRPQCSAVVSLCQLTGYTGDWRKRAYAHKGKNWKKCTRFGAWMIDGKPYCALHAGQLALQQLKEQPGE